MATKAKENTEAPKAEAPEIPADEWAARIKAKAKKQLQALEATKEAKVDTEDKTEDTEDETES